MKKEIKGICLKTALCIPYAIILYGIDVPKTLGYCAFYGISFFICVDVVRWALRKD